MATLISPPSAEDFGRGARLSDYLGERSWHTARSVDRLRPTDDVSVDAREGSILNVKQDSTYVLSLRRVLGRWMDNVLTRGGCRYMVRLREPAANDTFVERERMVQVVAIRMLTQDLKDEVREHDLTTPFVTPIHIVWHVSVGQWLKYSTLSQTCVPRTSPTYCLPSSTSMVCTCGRIAPRSFT